MPDHKFFHTPAPIALSALAEIAECELHAQADPDFVITDLSPLDQAAADHLSFLDNVKYKDAFRHTSAGACIVHPKFQDLAPADTHLLLSQHPYKSYALAAQRLYPQDSPPPDISGTVHVHESAKIAEGVVIEPYAVVGEGAVIGPHCWIGSHAVIGPSVQLGEHVRVGSHASISHAIIGNRVRIYPGVRIGQDGFGFAIDKNGPVRVPQLGRVMIEDSVEIGANTAIDRGSGPDTVIGAGTWIDNLVQIGHNVKIGKCCIIVAQAGISGSTVLDDFVALGGQAGIAGHLHIGAGARVAAQSGVMRDIPAGEEQMGSPSMPIKQFMRQIATLKQLVYKKQT